MLYWRDYNIIILLTTSVMQRQLSKVNSTEILGVLRGYYNNITGFGFGLPIPKIKDLHVQDCTCTVFNPMERKLKIIMILDFLVKVVTRSIKKIPRMRIFLR